MMMLVSGLITKIQVLLKAIGKATNGVVETHRF